MSRKAVRPWDIFGTRLLFVSVPAKPIWLQYWREEARPRGFEPLTFGSVACGGSGVERRGARDSALEAPERASRMSLSGVGHVHTLFAPAQADRGVVTGSVSRLATSRPLARDAMSRRQPCL